MLSVFPGPMQSLPKRTSQMQLIKDQDQQPTPPLKLLRSADMHLCPEQVLLQKAIAMFLREASLVVLSHLRQWDTLIKHDKPTHAGIPFGASRRFPFDADHTEFQLTVLLEMQVVPPTDARGSARLLLLRADFISHVMRLKAFALKERTIFGRRTTPVDAHGDAIAFEPDQDTVAQRLARSQELRRPIPAIRKDDDLSVAKEGTQGLQLRKSHPQWPFENSQCVVDPTWASSCWFAPGVARRSKTPSPR